MSAQVIELDAPAYTGARERLRSAGREALSDEELLALLLGTGRASEPVAVLAARVLASCGGLRGLRQLGVGGLSSLAGVGASKAARIVAALELGHRAAHVGASGDRMRSSVDIDAMLRARLAHLETERFMALTLDAKNRVTAEIVIATGGIASCAVSPADIFRGVLREAAVGVVFAHNHPSGESTPSEEDIAFTERLLQAGRLLGVRVLDHVIVARDGYFSFLDAGLLSAGEAES